MTIVGQEKPSLDDLVHFGVKGMKWGVRREQSATDRMHALNKKANKQNVEQVITGLGYTANAYKKQQAKALRKDPKFNFDKLTLDQQRAYLLKAPRKTAAQIALLGTVETAILLAGGNYAITKMTNARTSPQTLHGARVSLAILAGKSATYRMSQIRAVRAAGRYNVINNERDLLDPKQKMRKL